MKKLLFTFFCLLAFSGQPSPQQQILIGFKSGIANYTDISGLQLWLEADVGVTTYTTGYTGSGTTVSQSGNTLTGVSTIFLTEVTVGDTITGGLGLSGTVTAIASDTSLTLSSSATIAAETPYTITPVLGASERVTTWADQSGNSRDFTQSAASLKPAVIPSVQNGNKGIWFDVKNNRLARTGFASGTTYTFLIGFRPIASTGNYGCLTSDGSTSTGFYYRGASRKVSFYYSGDHLETTAITENAGHIYSCTVNAGAASFFLDGVADGTSASATSGSFNSIGDDGSGNRYKGYIVIILIYNSALSTSDRQAVEAKMNSKYAFF